ncbi:MAG: N-acetylmuramoyl-L-alanine amidase, partial [Acetatifactor sp.]|nr:N-acetylmuramoyl-L-alanine amidase [Acetatifactor sp.]
MGYTNSSLVNYTKISPNKSVPRNHAIDTITIHCMAGNLSVERCGNIFASTARKASSNYGIGSDGRIGMYVEEKDRSWCSSNSANDNRAVTIEVANDGGADTGWHVSDKAMTSLINLITDICKRNHIAKLVWSTNKNDRVKHLNGCNMTVHRDFAAKACPGDYLYGKHSYIAEQVNKKASASVSEKYIFENTDYSKVFDPIYYSNKYPDLKKAFGTDSNSLFHHFCTYGMKEGRIASTYFNVNKYKDYYADLR